MQAAGMLRGTGATRGFHVLLIGTLILAYISENAHALPMQLLPNIPGYIPVYIRYGDQPLDEINPALAEAFHEKQSLENTPPEGSDHSSDDTRRILENQPAYDDNRDEDDGGLNVGTRTEGTIFLIGVRQSGEDGKNNNGNLGPKIALPFKVLEREAIEANAAADNEDDDKSKDVWIEEHGKESSVRKPIGLSKEAIIKQASGLPADVKDLERLAAEVEKEETRPNDLYDSAIGNDRHVSSPRRPIAKITMEAEATKEGTDIESIIDDVEIANDGSRTIEDPKETRSSRSRTSERGLRPAIDPKESRPEEDLTDFMVQEE